MLNGEARFAIGTQYKTRGQRPRLCTVIEILRTFNSRDELVSIRYVSTHEFCGQSVAEHDVVEATIAMGFASEPSK